MFTFRSSVGPVELAFTDRLGGVSAPPYDSLNLALVGHDDPDALETNLGRVLVEFAPGARLADMHQVHGGDVVDPSVDDEQVGTGPVDGRPAGDAARLRPHCDGLVTEEPDLVLMVRAADCVPVLLADPDAGVVGAVHCGRPGLTAKVVPAAIARMRLLGARKVTAWVGPHVCGGCYEVPRQMQDDVAAAVPEARATTTWGTPSLDLGAGVTAQLRAHHVEVHDASRCTRESDDLYSHRRDGAEAGRQAGLIRIRR